MAGILGGKGVGRWTCVTTFLWSAVCLCAAWSLRAESGPAEARREALRAEIARHDELYFKKAAPEISDEAYDRLKREWVELERKSEAALSVERARENGARAEAARDGARGERVGDDRSGRFPTARHGSRMMSLGKVYSEEELRAFLRRVEKEARGAGWVIEPKYDGLAVSATYERGRLVRLVTRGNGSEGDDVTANAAAIRGLRRELSGGDLPERIEVRGEVFARFAEFARVNAERAAGGEALFANPRALAAGSLKLGDPAVVARRGLEVVFYGWGDVAPQAARPEMQSEFHERVKAWGLPGVARSVRAATVEDVCAEVRAFERARAALAFPTDGVVIKVDAVAVQEKLGATEQAPRWAVAYKFTTERARTRVKAIAVQVGRSGVLTPVAELEPVTLGGSVVTRATLHNAAEIARLDVRVGDAVWVEKAGEIIPAVVGVDLTGRAEAGKVLTKDVVREEARAGRFSFPEDCPACGAAVVTRRDEGALQYCPNRACEAQVAARLRHFTGANGVAIRGLGEATIEALVTSGRVRTAADLFRMTREDWRAMPGIGEKTAEKLVAAVEAGRRAELWRFIHGIGVPGVGVATSRILAARFVSLEEFAGAGKETLARIAGVGAAQAEAIGAFFAEPENRRLVEELGARGVDPRRDDAGARSGGVLAGKRVVLTGRLPTLTRAEAERRIATAGGLVEAGVTARTDFVVAGADAGEKRRRAEELGVRIIEEAEFLRLLAGDVTG